MLDVLDHVSASDGTVAAGLGAIGHVLIIGEFLTSRVAFVTGLGAGIAKDGGQHTLAGGQLGCRGTDFPAIDAQHHRLGVIFVALRDQPGTMVVARIAFLKAVGAGFGALVKVSCMIGMGLVGRHPASGKCR